LDKVIISEKFKLFDELWTPKIIGEMNGQYIKIAKIQGEFVWHTHDDEDEYFQVIKGSIVIHLREKDVFLNEGESFVVPKGLEHKPEAPSEAHIMMVVPKGAGHTGTTQSDMTVETSDQEWI
jgi:mannose-6-phosphate isomerase-like protein (cupin superfamily)